MHFILEYIGAAGVLTRPLDARRFTTPQPGDAVLLPDGRHGMIEGRDRGLTRPGEYHVCERPSGAFWGLCTDGPSPCGVVDISGGPFQSVPAARLEPTCALHTQLLWNWGDHGSGAGHGVQYLVPRRSAPTFNSQPLDPQPSDPDWRSQLRALAAQLRRQQRGTSAGSDLWASL